MKNFIITSDSKKWEMICFLKGNIYPALQDLDFAIQFLSNKTCQLQIEKTETIDFNDRKLSIVSVLKNVPENNTYLLFYLYIYDHESHENILVFPEGSLDSIFMFEKELDYDFLFYVFGKKPEVLKKLMEFIEK